MHTYTQTQTLFLLDIMCLRYGTEENVLVQKGRLCAMYYPALSVRSQETVNVSGAGDRFVTLNTSTIWNMSHCFVH